jgi:glucose/arabinose dehydrogenase
MKSVLISSSFRLFLLAGLLVFSLGSSCIGNRSILPGDDDTSSDDDDDSIPPPDPCAGVEQVKGTSINLVTVTTGLVAPTHATHAGDGTGRMFVVEQDGRVRAYSSEGDTLTLFSTFLDIRSRVSSGGERGLLSIAFHPSFETNGRFYVYYTRAGGDVVVSEFSVSGSPLSDLADIDSERILLVAEQPAGNHNGGQLVFGPDGYLYISIGDGGGAGDTYGNGQRKDTFLAKILRIDVDSGDPYGIPADNPFVNDPDHRPETWAWGMRNAWRVSFDRETGLMWIADVGQNAWEEIHVGVAGGNYGWPEMEANHCFQGDCDPDQFEPAIWEYPHSAGISITGGFVYRGCLMPDLQGVYFYSDYNYFNSPLWSLNWDGTSASEGPVNMSTTGSLISSFGEDEDGEIYICDHSGGRLLKMVPEGS